MITYSLLDILIRQTPLVKPNIISIANYLCYTILMEIRQRTELRRLLVPQLTQSLKILTLPLLDLKIIVQEEVTNNPLLEESQPKNTLSELSYRSSLPQNQLDSQYLEFRLGLLTKNISLQDILLKQLGIFTNTDEELRIGQEIIGNIDENGYLKALLEEIANTLNVTMDMAENVLKIIQQFEPAGVATRTVSECLLIQLKMANEDDPLMAKIIECHLEDIAKKNYSHIAKALKEPLDKVEPLIKRILRLNPKPGRNYSAEEMQRIIPDVIIEQKDEDNLEISINNEDVPSLNINKTYRDMLKKNDLDHKTKEFLTNKLRDALELLRAIFKRQRTLRKVIEIVAQIQQDAIKDGLSHLKPLTLQEVAQKINMHESTVSRTVMNKYVQLPWGMVALKDFFSSHIHDKNGQSISSSHIKGLIRELIENEDKKHPLSDEDISKILLNEKNLQVSRRTVAKYRDELKILSTPFRRER